MKKQAKCRLFGQKDTYRTLGPGYRDLLHFVARSHFRDIDMTKRVIWMIRVLRWMLRGVAHDLKLNDRPSSNWTPHNTNTLSHNNATIVLITLYTVLIRTIDTW